MTVVASTVQLLAPFVRVECRRCNKLVFRWSFSGKASVEIKCTRCGSLQTFNLST